MALEPIARNVGLRRANPANPWILSTNTDMLFIPRHPDGSLTQAVADLDDGYYALPRFDIPEALWESMDRRDPATNIELVRDWGPNLHLDSVVLSYPYNGFDAPGDFQLVRRDRLIEIDGFDEEMLHGWHVDSNLFKRLSFVYGAPGDLSAQLSGYHCDHTRLATAVHTTGGIQNDLHRFVEDVDRPDLPDQTPEWGLADVELEEIDLRAGAAARFATALARVAPPAEPTTPVVDGLVSTQLMHYETAHVLPYLVDPLTVLSAGATIAYAGLNGELASMTAAFIRELGFTTPLQILDVDGAPRPEGTTVVTFDELVATADAVVFDFGFPLPAGGHVPTAIDDWPRALRWQLGTVLDRFDQLVTADRAAGARAKPRRYLSVNSRSNIFEPFFTSRLVTTTTPYNTRTQHGFVADLSAPEVDAVMTPMVRGILCRLFGHGLTPKNLDYEIGTELDFTLGGDAHRYLFDGWSIPEPNGTWTDGDVADLRLELRAPDLTTEFGWLCTVDATGFLVPPDHCHIGVDVTVNDAPIGTIDYECGVSAPPARHLVVTDEVVSQKRPVEIVLRVDEPAVPLELGVSVDARRLGVRVQSLALRPRELAIGLGRRVVLGDAATQGDWLVRGWSLPEPDGVWTEGERAEIVLAPRDARPGESIDLAVEVRDCMLGTSHPKVAVDVTVDGVAVDRWVLAPGDPRHHIRRVPLRSAAALAAQPVTVGLAIDKPGRPVDLGRADDARLLGLKLSSLSVVRAGAPDPELLPGRGRASTLLDRARDRRSRAARTASQRKAEPRQP